MGLFDFFKKKKPKLPFAYPFSTSNSFRLFTEGLRAFQIWSKSSWYDKYSHLFERSQESYLTEALTCWGECYDKWPNDILPAFYLALALWADGQREESLKLFNDLCKRDPDGEVGKCAQFNIVALQYGDTHAEAARLGLPEPPQ